jgi:signal transduction histidine kinase
MVAGKFGRLRHSPGSRATGTRATGAHHPGTGAHHSGYAGRRRGARIGRTGRLRSIRGTITVLLIVPLLSLVALWLYAASGTVGPATAERDANAVNNDVGNAVQGLVEGLSTERTDTFIWQSAHGHVSASSMDADRPKTDAAISAFRTGAAAAYNDEPATVHPLAQELISALGTIGTLRTQVDDGKLSAIAAFQAYNSLTGVIEQYSESLSNPDASLSLYKESQVLIEEGQAEQEIAEEATLLAGALVSGNRLPASEQRVFVQAVDDERQLAQMGTSPLDWQPGSPDPYLGLTTSKPYTNWEAVEDAVMATAPGALLKVSSTTWENAAGAIINEFTAAENSSRLTVTAGDAHQSDVIIWRLVLVGGAGLLAVVISSLLLLQFGNRIRRELTGLRGAARSLANERLPSVVARLRAGEDLDVDTEAPPLALPTRTKEVAETADAFSAVQWTAVQAAVEQAQLRKGVSLVFRSLARRNQSLLQRQLRMLDEMERNSEDPESLEQLFALDHLTTRMRRQAEGLIILSGAAPGRGWRKPVPVIEALRGALGEIEDYNRVELNTESPDFLQGAGVADVTHLLAELIENAVLYSPPGTKVSVRCGRVANGYVIEIEDGGLGIPDEIMGRLNVRLAQAPDFDLADSDQLGLFVVSRLAVRHQIKVSLRTSGYGGTLAVVLLPHTLVVSEEETVFLAAEANRPSTGRQPALPGTGPSRPGAGPHAVPAARQAALPRSAAPSGMGSSGMGPNGTGPNGTGPNGLGSNGLGSNGTGTGPNGIVRPGGLPARQPAGRGPAVPTNRMPRGLGEGAPAAAGPTGSSNGQPGLAAQPAAAAQFIASVPSAPTAPSGMQSLSDLPRRESGANMAPQLRASRAEAPKTPVAGRSPEQARALLSAIRTGWRSGVAESDGLDMTTGNGAQPDVSARRPEDPR